jgi:hypothetical protein
MRYVSSFVLVLFFSDMNSHDQRRIPPLRGTAASYVGSQIDPASGAGAARSATTAGGSSGFSREAVFDDVDGIGGPAALPHRSDDGAARTIITRNDSPDISFDRSINPYRGCEHGCSYCFARPTHTYLGLSAGLDFESGCS